MKKKYGIFFAVLVLISGCTNNITNIMSERADFKKPTGPKEVVSVIVNGGFVGGADDPKAGAMTRGVIGSFKKSGLFQRVDVNNADANYVFDINVEESSSAPEQAGSSIMNAAAALFTPIDVENTIIMDTTVKSKNAVLRTYTHKIKVKESKFISQSLEQRIHESMDVLTSFLFQDMQRDKLISAD